MEITEVRVKLMDEPGERLQAFCSITFDDSFVVRDLKIIEGATGPFVAMPSRKLTAHCSQCGCKNHLRAAFCNQCGARLKEQQAIKDEEGRAKLYADIAHPINSACREMIQERVIKAFAEEKERARMPGYVSSYDDFDRPEPAVPAQVHSPSPEPSAPPPAHWPQPVEPTQVQPAEQPRGPHRAPAQQPQPKESANDGFGAGIFE